MNESTCECNYCAELDHCKIKEDLVKETARQIFLELEEHDSGWDGISVNVYWVKIIKEKYGCSDIETREVGVNIKPFSPPTH